MRVTGSFGINAYNDTWGHLAPLKNISYKGIVRFVYTEHSHYGCQAIIISYDFENLYGPYLHNLLFDPDTIEKGVDKKEIIESGVYEMKMTFRNYRFYYGKPRLILQP